MVAILLDIVFALCLLAWLVWVTTIAVLATSAAVGGGRVFTHALIHSWRCLRGRGARFEQLGNPDSQFLRATGIKR